MAMTITVNGKKLTLDCERLSYDDLVQLAYPRRPTGDVLYTITYYRGPGGIKGTLVPGQTVPVGPDMIFNAVYTGNA